MADAAKMLLQAPLPQIIERLGVAIASAQLAIDRNSVEIARLLADDEHGVDFGAGRGKVSMLELGFAPTFYQLTEVNVEAKVAFAIGESRELRVGASVGIVAGVYAASVDASYTAKYSFDASGSSAFTARFVSVPAPAVFHEMLRAPRGGAAPPK